jgi:hypothetical protein
MLKSTPKRPKSHEDRLSSRDRRLLKLAADAAEQSYRRGVQQGVVSMRQCIDSRKDPDALERKIADWRFQRRPYRAAIGAPGLGRGTYYTPVSKRFEMESAGETFCDFLRGGYVRP